MQCLNDVCKSYDNLFMLVKQLHVHLLAPFSNRDYCSSFVLRFSQIVKGVVYSCEHRSKLQVISPFHALCGNRADINNHSYRYQRQWRVNCSVLYRRGIVTP